MRGVDKGNGSHESEAVDLGTQSLHKCTECKVWSETLLIKLALVVQQQTKYSLGNDMSDECLHYSQVPECTAKSSTLIFTPLQSKPWAQQCACSIDKCTFPGVVVGVRGESGKGRQPEGRRWRATRNPALQVMSTLRQNALPELKHSGGDIRILQCEPLKEVKWRKQKDCHCEGRRAGGSAKR